MDPTLVRPAADNRKCKQSLSPLNSRERRQPVPNFIGGCFSENCARVAVGSTHSINMEVAFRTCDHKGSFSIGVLTQGGNATVSADRPSDERLADYAPFGPCVRSKQEFLNRQRVPSVQTLRRVGIINVTKKDRRCGIAPRRKHLHRSDGVRRCKRPGERSPGRQNP